MKPKIGSKISPFITMKLPVQSHPIISNFIYTSKVLMTNCLNTEFIEITRSPSSIKTALLVKNGSHFFKLFDCHASNAALTALFTGIFIFVAFKVGCLCFVKYCPHAENPQASNTNDINLTFNIIIKLLRCTTVNKQMLPINK